MRLLDKSAWTEEFIDGVLRAKIDALLPGANECVVPSLV
jgi:predicted nucleic acid-binding protein